MRITVLTTTEEFEKVLVDYRDAILASKKNQTAANRENENRLQGIAEEKLRQLISPKGILRTSSGKFGQPITTDYSIDYDKISESQIAALKKTLIGKYGLEAKLSSKLDSGVKIGQITIRNTEKKIFGPGVETLTGSDIFTKLELEGTKSLVQSIDSKNLTDYLFNTLFPMFPSLKTIFYSKSSSMIINTFDSNNKPLTYVLEVPLKNFTSQNYKAVKDGDAIVLYLNDNFQKSIISGINEASKSVLEKIPINKITLSNKQVAELFFKPADKFLEFAIDIVGSIGTVPGGGVRLKVLSSKKKVASTKIISNAELTALVQKITENKMPHGPLRGPPISPTVLTYRSGQFVNSVKVIQDLRQQLIKYYYAPNYRVHEKLGARAPRFLLQASIREAVKQVYGTQFKIIRGF